MTKPCLTCLGSHRFTVVSHITSHLNSSMSTLISVTSHLITSHRISRRVTSHHISKRISLSHRISSEVLCLISSSCRNGAPVHYLSHHISIITACNVTVRRMDLMNVFVGVVLPSSRDKGWVTSLSHHIVLSHHISISGLVGSFAVPTRLQKQRAGSPSSVTG